MDSKSPRLPDADGLVPSDGPVYAPSNSYDDGARGLSVNPEFSVLAIFDNGAVRDGNSGALRTLPFYETGDC
jgi:hypothetical protein